MSDEAYILRIKGLWCVRLRGRTIFSSDSELVACEWLRLHRVSQERWTSNAEWPRDTYFGMGGDGISTDTHTSESEARAVCRGLERDGFGGQRQSFPIRTWVEKKS